MPPLKILRLIKHAWDIYIYIYIIEAYIKPLNQTDRHDCFLFVV
jgi:hypothetical protein